MSAQCCHLREHSVRGLRALTLSNGLVSATVLPEKGADIYSLVYEPRSLDVLWKSPWGLRHPGGMPAAPTSEVAWLDHYAGGWQEIFPNGGDACEYRGAALSFHGEASVAEWDYSVRQDGGAAVEIDFTVELARSPFRIRRTMRVERGLAALLLDEQIENRGEEDLHFMWGHHPALGAPFLAGGCLLQIPARAFEAHDVEISPACRVAAGARGGWPGLTGKSGQRVDLSVVPEAGERVTEFGYLRDLDAGWYGFSNPELGLGFGLAWPAEVFPYLWFWQELRGSFGYPWYGRCYVMAVEPFTSIPGAGLERAMERGTAPILAAGANIQARLAAVFFAGGEIDSITLDGAVQVRTGPV